MRSVDCSAYDLWRAYLVTTTGRFAKFGSFEVLVPMAAEFTQIDASGPNLPYIDQLIHHIVAS